MSATYRVSWAEVFLNWCVQLLSYLFVLFCCFLWIANFYHGWQTVLKLTNALDFLNRSLNKLLTPVKQSFWRFKNEISLIISDFDKRAEQLGQYYTEKEVNPDEIELFLDENVLIMQNIQASFVNCRFWAATSVVTLLKLSGIFLYPAKIISWL